MDGVGCGSQDDYLVFNSQKSNTLKSIYERVLHFRLPNLERLGLAHVISNSPDSGTYVAGLMREKTMAIDTFAGIWEMLGVVSNHRFRTSGRGLPSRVLREIEQALGVFVIGNRRVSGAKVLQTYFQEHQRTRAPILYLADDGVVLLAAHANVISPSRLNSYARSIGPILHEHGLNRIITTPFGGDEYALIRLTEQRLDVVLRDTRFPHSLIRHAQDVRLPFFVTEHIYNILGRPTHVDHLPGNLDNRRQLDVIVSQLETRKQHGVMMFCLEDFDLIAHQKNVEQYAKSLAYFDSRMLRVLSALDPGDLLIITADHGCNPTLRGRGHTREHVPLLLYSERLKQSSIWLGVRRSFADLGQTISHNFGLPNLAEGEFIHEIF